MAVRKKSSGKVIGRAILHILSILLALVLLVICCLTLVLAQPQEDSRTQSRASQPLLSPSPAYNINEETGLRELVSGFPVPVMSFMSGSGRHPSDSAQHLSRIRAEPAGNRFSFHSGCRTNPFWLRIRSNGKQ